MKFNLIIGLLICFYLNFVKSNQLDGKGDNVCFKNITITEKVQKTKPHYFTVNTYKLCYKILCSQTKTELRTYTYSEEVKKNKTIPVCCPGYFESNHKCKPLCEKGCVHGDCVEPDTCSCDIGFGGKSCIETCPNGKFGLDCEFDCSCLLNPHCNKNYQQCSCVPGKISDKCKNICKCRLGCELEPNGKICNKICPIGFYGPQCKDKCKCFMNGTAKCLAETGECQCKSGYYGDNCENKCHRGDSNCKLEKSFENSNEIDDGKASSTFLGLDKLPAQEKTSNYNLIFGLMALLILTVIISGLFITKYQKKNRKLKKDLQSITIRYSTGGSSDQFDNPVYSYASTNGISTTYNSSIASTIPRTNKLNGYLIPEDVFAKKNMLADSTNPNLIKKDNSFNSNIYTTIDEVLNQKDELDQPFRIEEDNDSVDIALDKAIEKKDNIKLEENFDNTMHYDKPKKAGNISPINDNTSHYDYLSSSSTNYDNLKK